MSRGARPAIPAGLGDELRRRAPEFESSRQLADDVVERLRAAGVYRMWVPRAYGGPEIDAQSGLDMIAELSEHDAATGWCVMIAVTSTLQAYLLPAEHATEIYGDPDVITGGFAMPRGKALPVPGGGLRVTGRWAWGSGTSHCTWIGGGCRVVGADGSPRARDDGLAAPFVFFPRADVCLLDTWHVTGLAGTGSTDYEVDDVFVPEGRWVVIGSTEPVVQAPLAGFPFYGLLAVGVSAVLVGIARRAVAEICEMAGAKRPQGSRRTLAERDSTQAEVARADAAARSSWALLCDAVGDTWQTTASGDPPTLDQRRLLRLAATDAAVRCADAVHRLYLTAGGDAVYLDSPMQRLFRDAHVATQHAMVARRTYELAGRLLLGLDTDTRQL